MIFSLIVQLGIVFISFVCFIINSLFYLSVPRNDTIRILGEDFGRYVSNVFTTLVGCCLNEGYAVIFTVESLSLLYVLFIS